MAAKGDASGFANYALIQVTESAANTLSFKKLETGISLMDKVAWVINRVEYILDSLLAARFDTNGDSSVFGLCVSNAFATPDFNQDTIIDYNSIQRADYGTSAVAFLNQQPFIKNFADLPGGGILVPPVPLYLYAKGTGLAAAQTIQARIHYTVRELAESDYWGLIEARRVISS